jgi:hypothetical protein
VSLKIRVFLWEIFQNRIPTAQQLRARDWKGSERCVLCGLNEDIDHLLFTCPLASFVWALASEALGWQGFPRSLEDLMCNWISRKFGMGRQLGLACFACIAWGSGTLEIECASSMLFLTILLMLYIWPCRLSRNGVS